MKIKYRIMITTILQSLLLVFLIYFFFNSNNSLKTMISMDLDSKNTVYEMNNMSLNIKDYFNGKISYEQLSSKQNELADRIGDSAEFAAIVKSFNDIMNSIKESDAISKENNDHISKIVELTSLSIQRSNAYISETITNLSDANKKDKVTPLEITVIGGASNNTSLNYEIQVLAHKMMIDMSAKDQLMELLDKSIENSTDGRQYIQDDEKIATEFTRDLSQYKQR